MKIALFVPSWPPGSSANGIVTYASELIPALRNRGHDVFVLTFSKKRTDDPHTIDLNQFSQTRTMRHRLAARVFPEASHFRAVTHAIASSVEHLILTHDVDIFEIEESFGWSLAISRLQKIPVVVRLHGPWFLNGRFEQCDPAQRLRRERQEEIGIREAHFVTSPSKHVLEATKSHYRVNLPASRIIANPISAAKCAETWKTPAQAPETLLFVGRFDARKGGDLVVRAFNEIAASRPDARLTFLGPDRGVIGTNGQTVGFNEFVRQNVLEEHRARVDFRGEVNHSEVMRCRITHSVTIIASRYEIGPYSVLEPMSLGCPIVTTAVGGIPELIEHQRNGLLIPTQNVGALVEAYGRLSGDHGMATRLGRQAWLDCRKFHDPEIIAKETIAAYEEAIANFESRLASRHQPVRNR